MKNIKRPSRSSSRCGPRSLAISALKTLDETLNYADIQIAVDDVMLNAAEPIRLMEDMAQQVIDRSPAIRAWLPSPFASKSHGHPSRIPVACP